MLQRIEDILKTYAGKVDYLEARIEEAQSTNIALRGRDIDNLREGMTLGGFVRAYHNGGVSYASFNDLDRMGEFAAKVTEQARMVGRSKTVLAEAPVVQDERQVQIRKDPRDIPIKEKLERLQAYNDVILGFDKRIPTSSIRYADGYRRIYFGNGEGTRLVYEKLDIGCSMAAIALGDAGSQIGTAGFGSSTDYDVIEGHEERLKEECRAAVQALEAEPIKGGAYTAILDPHLSGVFAHEAFGHQSEGEKVCDNPRMAEVMKMGRKFGTDDLTIYDTGLSEGTRGAILYDEEGVAGQHTDLIKNGVLVGRLHTRESAGKMGEAVTGSARAMNHTFPPINRMRNTCIAAGKATFEDMIADIKLGVYALKSVGGQAGEMFTFTPGRVYMIRNGKVEELVRNAVLSGNLFTTLANIDMIGNDFHQHNGGGGCGKGTDEGFQFPLPVSDGAPHIRIQNVVIGGK